MTRRSLFRLSATALLGAVAAPLASLVPEPEPARFVGLGRSVAHIRLVPPPPSAFERFQDLLGRAAEGDAEALGLLPAARETLMAECRYHLVRP